MIRSLAVAVFALPMLSACATAPEPCTAAWFDWKTERIIGGFVYDHRKEISSLRDIAPTLFAGGAPKDSGPSAMMALSAVGALQLVIDFAGDTWPQISDAVSECATAPDATRLFADMLRREGVDERAVAAIEQLGALVDIKR